MARAYYEAQSGFFAPEADCTENEDGTYTIHLYEIVKDEEGNSWHTATSCWYTVDASGRGRDDISEAEIALPPPFAGGYGRLYWHTCKTAVYPGRRSTQ